MKLAIKLYAATVIVSIINIILSLYYAWQYSDEAFWLIACMIILAGMLYKAALTALKKDATTEAKDQLHKLFPDKGPPK